MPFKDIIKALGSYGGREEGLDNLAPEVAENPFYIASQSEGGMSRRTFIKAALAGTAAACGAGKVGKALAQGPVSVYVEDFGECFFVPDINNATPGIGPGTSSQIANYLAYFKDKGIKVNRGRKENSQIVVSGQVVVDWYHSSMLINVEYKNPEGEVIERDTFAHNFYDYPNCLFEDSKHIAEELGSAYDTIEREQSGKQEYGSEVELDEGSRKQLRDPKTRDIKIKQWESYNCIVDGDHVFNKKKN